MRLLTITIAVLLLIQMFTVESRHIKSEYTFRYKCTLLWDLLQSNAEWHVIFNHLLASLTKICLSQFSFLIRLPYSFSKSYLILVVFYPSLRGLILMEWSLNATFSNLEHHSSSETDKRHTHHESHEDDNREQEAQEQYCKSLKEVH